MTIHELHSLLVSAGLASSYAQTDADARAEVEGALRWAGFRSTSRPDHWQRRGRGFASTRAAVIALVAHHERVNPLQVAA